MSLSLIAYKVAFDEIQANAIRMQEANIEQSRAVIDGRIKEVKDLSIQIKSIPLVEAFAVRDKEDLSKNMYSAVQLVREMEKFKIVNDAIADYAVIYKNSDKVLYQSFLNDFDYFYPDNFQMGDLDAQSFRDLVYADYYTSEALSSYMFRGDALKTNGIPVLTTIGFNRSNPQAVIMLIIDQDKLRDYMTGVASQEGGNFYILNGQGQVVMKLYDDGIPFTSQLLQERMDDPDYMVFTEASQAYDWDYVLVQNEAEVFKGVNALAKGAIILNSLILFIGLLTSFILARSNTKPIQVILNDNEDMALRMQQQRPFMRQTFLQNWLYGKYKNEEELRSVARFLKASYEGDKYGVIVIDIDESSDVFDDVDEDQMTTLETRRLLVKEVLIDEDLVGEGFIHDVDRDKLAIIYVDSVKDGDQEDHLNTLLEKVSEAISRKVIESFVIGIGDIYDEMSGVTSSMIEAQEASQNSGDKDQQSLVWYKKLQVQNESYYYPPEVETRLYNATRAGDTGQVEQVLRDLLNKNVLERSLSPNMMKLFIYEVWGTLTKIPERFSNKNQDVGEYINESFNKLESLTDVEKIHHSKNVFIKISQMLSVEKENRHKGTMDAINAYVMDNYCDPDFGLMMISDKFSLSEAYISQIFKDFNGENFINHLQDLRMKKAEDLLITTKMPIKEIVSQVGYNSSNSFGKAFKRRHGISASVFRDRVRQATT